MKLSKIYSNLENQFPSIVFSEGFNIIFAEIRNPENQKKHTHNLGKTTLARLLDFMLLKEIKGEDHFLIKSHDKFLKFVFFLEIKLNSDEYLTIQRSVTNHSKVSFVKHPQKHQDYSKTDSTNWNQNQIPINKAKILLDSYLSLLSLKPWNYRDGVSYFLRIQEDYSDVFQLKKFFHHSDWKPYLAQILGFVGEQVKENYDLQVNLEDLESKKTRLLQEVPFAFNERDKVKGRWKIKQKEVESLQNQLDKFSFHLEEEKFSRELVDDVESKISRLHNKKYSLDYDTKKIKNSLEHKIDFNLNEIKQTFDEANIYFSDQLIKDYEDLLQFNKKIIKERKSFLKKQLKELEKERGEIINNLKELDEQRQFLLETIKGEDTFKKYKSLQKNLVQAKTELNSIEHQFEILEKVYLVEKEIQQIKKRKNDIVLMLEENISQDNQIYESIRLFFAEIMKEVADVTANLSTRINMQGNLMFEEEIVDAKGGLTSKDKGHSFKKLLCVSFDLAVLRCYSNENFFHFVYHDGPFEGLDERIRINLLNLMRRYCDEFNIQEIITVIDSDWPKNPQGGKLEIIEGEIVRQLHDDGQEGRLFQMDEF